MIGEQGTIDDEVILMDAVHVAKMEPPINILVRSIMTEKSFVLVRCLMGFKLFFIT
jgi:hypothetical protein